MLNSEQWMHYFFQAAAVGLAVLWYYAIKYFANRNVRARAQRKARLKPTYFLTWLTDQQKLALQGIGIGGRNTNLGTLRYELKLHDLRLQELAAQRRRWPWSKSAAARVPTPFVSLPAPALDPDEEGILIGGQELDTAFRALGWYKATTIATNISIAQSPVFQLITCQPARRHSSEEFVVSSSETFAGSERVKEITQNLLASPLLCNVKLVSGSAAIVDDGTIRVVFNSSAKNGSQIQLPAKIWGLSMGPEQQLTHGSSGLGKAIVTTEGYTVAELVGFNLYIHHDLFASKNVEQSIAIYTRILQELQGEFEPAKLVDRIAAENGVKATAVVNRPTLKAKANTIKIVGLRADFLNKQLLSSLCNRLLLPALDCNLVISFAAGCAQPVRKNAASLFTIVFWSSPVGEPCEATPSNLFGLQAQSKGASFSPSGLGLPLVDDDGFIVGEIVDRTLYVHFNWPGADSLTQARIFARLLSAANEALRAIELREEESAQQKRDQFIESCANIALPKGRRQVKDSKALAVAQAALHTAITETRAVELDLYQLELAPEAELAREFDRLLDLANVLDVKVSGNKLCVTTDLLFCRDSRTRKLHEIGAFEIQISTDGRAKEVVRWFNLTRKVAGVDEGMNAPHVYSNGAACLGNTEDLFPMLIAKRDFASAVQVAIAFVEAANVDDEAGKHINNWPLSR